MTATDTALDADWLGACRRAVERPASECSADAPTTAERAARPAPAAAAATARW